MSLTREGCEARQRRMLQAMEAAGWDLFVTGDYAVAHYFSGVLGPAEWPSVFALWNDGRSLLITPAASENACASQVRKLETYSIQRTITRTGHDAVELFRDAMRGRTPRVCAVERGASAALLESAITDLFSGVAIEDATDTVLALRKKKEEDEIDEIRRSLRLNAVAYDAARKAIAPGRTEIEVYLEMYAAAVREAGTAVKFIGDFACGERGIEGGGPPTTRTILPGDLYILDLFPAHALYAGDTCRTFAVGAPTDLQQQAWHLVNEAVALTEAAVKPGVLARDVYRLTKDFLDASPVSGKSFWHHLGHGIGFRGHEAPRIIPGTEDRFEVGDVITFEPGVYGQALQGGIRLEDNYVVRENGLENLFPYPREL